MSSCGAFHLTCLTSQPTLLLLFKPAVLVLLLLLLCLCVFVFVLCIFILLVTVALSSLSVPLFISFLLLLLLLHLRLGRAADIKSGECQFAQTTSVAHITSVNTRLGRSNFPQPILTATNQSQSINGWITGGGINVRKYKYIYHSIHVQLLKRCRVATLCVA